MKRVHTSNDERKSKCDQRGKGFTEKETYVGHMNMHLETFKCQHCGARNQNQYILFAHDMIQFVGDMLSGLCSVRFVGKYSQIQVNF